MKRSQLVTITLLAASVAMWGCHHHRYRSRHIPAGDFGTDSYISSDGGYSYYGCQPGLPFWFWYMMLNNHGRYYYGSSMIYYARPAYGYGVYSHGYGGRSYGRAVMSSGGRSYTFGSSSMRGGFGSLGRAAGA